MTNDLQGVQERIKKEVQEYNQAIQEKDFELELTSKNLSEVNAKLQEAQRENQALSEETKK